METPKNGNQSLQLVLLKVFEQSVSKIMERNKKHLIRSKAD